MASSKQCPLWKKEKEIPKVKTGKKITKPEAKKMVQIPYKWKFQREAN